MYPKFFGYRLLAVLVLVGVLFAVGSAVFQMGYAQGWSQGALVQAASQSGSSVPNIAPGYAPWYGQGYAPGYPYAPGFFGPRFGFFPFFPLGLCLAGLFFLFLIGFLLRGPRRWGKGQGHTHPWWGTPPWEQGGPGQAEPTQPEAGPSTPQEEDQL